MNVDALLEDVSPKVRCVACGASNPLASVANAVLCTRCSIRTLSVGYDCDRVPLHYTSPAGEELKTLPYGDRAWVQAHALRPDGSPAKRVNKT